jgi:hypothetical protein
LFRNLQNDVRHIARARAAADLTPAFSV